jgi:hypothetical protein
VPLIGVLYIYSYLFSIQTIDIAYYSYAVGIGLALVILWPIRNELYEYRRINLSSGIRVILFVGMLLSTCFILKYRVFPNLLSTFTTEERPLVTELPYWIFNVLLLLSRKNRLSISSIFHLLCLIIVIMLGERVGSIVTVVVLLIMDGEKNIREKVDRKVLYLALPAVFILGTIAGFLRIGITLSIDNIISQFYSQGTTCDVLYVYLCSVDYYVQHGTVPAVLLYHLQHGIIPGLGISSEHFFGNFLKEQFPTYPGGGLFFSEGMLAFGVFGVLMYLSAIALFLKYCFTRRRGIIPNALFLLIIISLCRTMWYGIHYLTQPIFILSIIMLGLTYYLRDHRRSLRLSTIDT